MLLDSKLVSN